MPSNKGPTPIKGAKGEFEQREQINLEKVKSWVVDPAAAAAEQLLEDWQGGVIGLVNITLSNDNSSVDNARFLLQGRLFRDSPKFVPCNKIWPARAQNELVLEDLDCSLFRFSNSLVSNLVDSSETEISFRTSAGQPLIGTDLDDINMSGFCLRAFVWPSTPNFAKLGLLLYPLAKEELLEVAPLAIHPAFPGISLFSVEFPIGPPSDSFRFGLPFFPAVSAGGCFDSFPNFPPREEFVEAAAALLRKATYPEIKVSRTTLQKRWTELEENGNNPNALKSKKMSVIWPLPPVRASIPSGRLAAISTPSCFFQQIREVDRSIDRG